MTKLNNNQKTHIAALIQEWLDEPGKYVGMHAELLADAISEEIADYLNDEAEGNDEHRCVNVPCTECVDVFMPAEEIDCAGY